MREYRLSIDLKDPEISLDNPGNFVKIQDYKITTQGITKEGLVCLNNVTNSYSVEPSQTGNLWKLCGEVERVPSPTQTNLHKRENGVELFRRNIIPIRGILGFSFRRVFLKLPLPIPYEHILISVCDPIGN